MCVTEKNTVTTIRSQVTLKKKKKITRIFFNFTVPKNEYVEDVITEFQVANFALNALSMTGN